MSNSDTFSKYEMKAEHRLGKGKDGVVDIKTWKRELKITALNYFGKMALPIEMEEYPEWAKPGKKKFVYRASKVTKDSGTGEETEELVEKKTPEEGDSDYEDYQDEKSDFRDLVKQWEDKGPKIIGLLLNGSMDGPTRVRLLQIIDNSGADSLLTKIKRNIDPLRLVEEMTKVHYFTGNQADKEDKMKAEQLFRTFRETPIGHGVNVTEHKNKFEEHIRRLTSFNSIGNDDP